MIRQARSHPSTAPSLSSASMGYKMCTHAYINGDGIGKRTHLSLFFVLIK